MEIGNRKQIDAIVVSERKFTYLLTYLLSACMLIKKVLFYWNENQKRNMIFPLCLITSQLTDSDIFTTFVNLLFF